MRNAKPLLIFVIVAVVIAAVAVGWYATRSRDDGRAGEPQSRIQDGRLATQSFATWDEFLADRQSRAQGRHQVVFIGIDGATWELLDPMIDEGLLPTLERLKQEGSWGVLKSVQSYVSPPAWTTMMTGYLPERTGVYNFGHWIRERRTFEPIGAGDVAVPFLWDITSGANLKTAAVNIPVTYPAEPVNGIMLSGLLTPVTIEERKAQSLEFAKYDGKDLTGLPPLYSPVISASLDHRGNRFEFFLCDTRNDNVVRYDRVFLRLASLKVDGTGYGPTVNHLFDLQRYSPWLKITYDADETLKKAWCRLGVLSSKDPARFVIRFSHVLFSYADTDILFASPSSLIDDMKGRFDYYFPSTYLDRELVPEVTGDCAVWASYFYDYDDWDLFAYVFTQSDNILHADGMSPIAKNVFHTIDRFIGVLIEKLPDDCTLIVASDHGFEEYNHTIDLNKLFEQMGLLEYGEGQKIDYENSLVFHNIWCIYFNDSLLKREELERRGISCPHRVEPRDALIDYLKTAVQAKLQLAVEFTEVDPNSAGSPPDMIVKGTYDDYQIEMWNISKPGDKVVTRLEGSARWFHNRDGIFVVYGRDVKKGVEMGPSDIQDITPTVLYRLGLPVAADMDGRVMTDVFVPASTVAPLYLVEQYEDIPWESVVTEVEQDSLEKRLRSLGYIR